KPSILAFTSAIFWYRFSVLFSVIEWYLLIFNCGCFGYLYDCILPCFNQRLPVIFIRLVILFPFSSISSTFGKIIPIFVCHILSGFFIFFVVSFFIIFYSFYISHLFFLF